MDFRLYGLYELRTKHIGLGSSLFARHYLGNKLLFYFPPGTEMFHFPGFASRFASGLPAFSGPGSSPFGDLRIKGRSAPPRSLSQLCRVLHRLFESRHPPYALKFPIRKFIKFTPLLAGFVLVNFSTASEELTIRLIFYLRLFSLDPSPPHRRTS